MQEITATTTLAQLQVILTAYLNQHRQIESRALCSRLEQVRSPLVDMNTGQMKQRVRSMLRNNMGLRFESGMWIR